MHERFSLVSAVYPRTWKECSASIVEEREASIVGSGKPLSLTPSGAEKDAYYGQMPRYWFYLGENPDILEYTALYNILPWERSASVTIFTI